ncbi:hypothetical protein FocTR4_00010844, partial [Fusarium oxysporum f. sp. cubense]
LLINSCCPDALILRFVLVTTTAVYCYFLQKETSESSSALILKLRPLVHGREKGVALELLRRLAEEAVCGYAERLSLIITIPIHAELSPAKAPG